MSLENFALAGLVLVSILLIVYVMRKSSAGTGARGKLLLSVVLLVLPALLLSRGLSAQLEMSKKTEFCLSCHVMQPYGRSLRIDDDTLLPAAHFQNRRVPRDEACYTCHTTYAMFGDLQAKLQGMKHVYVYYLGTVSEPIELYSDYNNRECLHCHQGARSFEDNEDHMDLREDLGSNEVSCLDCHDLAHEIEELEGVDIWDEVAE